MPSFKIIGLLVLEKNIFKVFTIYGHGGHLCHVIWTIYINFLSHLAKEAAHKIWASIGQVVSEEKTFEIVDRRLQTTDAGPWVSYKLTYELLAQVS